MRKEDCFYLGKIAKKFSFKGEVLAYLDTDEPELYENLESVFVDHNKHLVPFFIEKSSWSKLDALNIAFKNSSEALVDQSLNKDVYLPLSTLPKLTGKQFYYHEVIGFEIMDQDNKDCGVIRSINDQTAQNYFVTNLYGKEVVIPLIKDWIIEVNREERFIKIELPEGLIDVFLVPSKKDE